MMTPIVRSNNIIQYVYLSIRMTMSHVAIQAGFQRAIESLDQSSLNVVVQAEIVMNVVFAKNVLNLCIEEFQSTIGLKHVRNAFTEYRFECGGYGDASLVSDRHSKCISRKHVDAVEYVGKAVIVG